MVVIGPMINPPPSSDVDGDGTPDIDDNCPDMANRDQLDSDGKGDMCDDLRLVPTVPMAKITGPNP